MTQTGGQRTGDPVVEHLRPRDAPAARTVTATEPRRSRPQRRRAEEVIDLREGKNPNPQRWVGPDLKLSILMPAHNEGRLIEASVDRLLGVRLPCEVELIVIDDGSSDETSSILESFGRDITVLRHEVRRGKGSAVLTGAAAAHGTHLLIFDADHEYDPLDIPRLLEPVVAGVADVVFGPRIAGLHTRYPSFRFVLGNRMTTLAANILFDAWVTDLHTCLKLVPLGVFRELTLTETGFGLDTEITAELLRRGWRPFEVPVSYLGRSRAEGKNITWWDGVECLGVLVRVRLRRRSSGTSQVAAAVPTARLRKLRHPSIW